VSLSLVWICNVDTLRMIIPFSFFPSPPSPPWTAISDDGVPLRLSHGEAVTSRTKMGSSESARPPFLSFSFFFFPRSRMSATVVTGGVTPFFSREEHRKRGKEAS